MKAEGMICQEKLNLPDQRNAPEIYSVMLNYRKWQDAKDCPEPILKSTDHKKNEAIEAVLYKK
jgi:hypothetical protein